MPRPRKPTALRVLQGNPGKRPLPQNEPAPPEGKVECPKMGPRAAAVWREYAPQVEVMGLLKPVDVPAFAMLCNLIAESIAKPRTMPASRIARMESLFGRFGMTPADRAKLGTPKKPTANPFAELTG